MSTGRPIADVSSAISKQTKKPRVRTHFKANIAPSLSLPTSSTAPASISSKPINFAKALTSIASNAIWMLSHSPQAIRSLASSNPAEISRDIISMVVNSMRSLQHIQRLPHALLTDYAANTISSTSTIAIKKEIIQSQARIIQHREKADAQSDNKINEEELEQIKLLKNQIIEHAERRVDFFFYLLVAVYKKNIVLQKGKTELQNGVGSKDANTQACHSSLFPNVTINPANNSADGFLIKTAKFIISKAYSGINQEVSLEGTHFMEVLNSTIELPKMVNDFDGHLEGGYQFSNYVESCVNILNRASVGEITPVDGMHLFFNRMNDFFIHFENKYINENHLDFKKNKYPASPASKLIYEYQRQGTFKPANKDLTVDMGYVYMMLGIHTMWDYLKPIPLYFYYKKIQDEIYQSPSLKKNSS